MSIFIDNPNNLIICHLGCGNPAKYLTKSGKYLCDSHASKCPSVRKKNSDGVIKSYNNGNRLSGSERYKNLPVDAKDRMNWNKNNFSNVEFRYNGKGSHKKALLYERGHKCESCNLTEWLNKPITIELEHIDGDNKNNEKSNLKLLCPNCHSQTDTWKGRNSKNKKKHNYVSDEDFIKALEHSPNIKKALIELKLTPKAANYERAYRLLHDDK